MSSATSLANSEKEFCAKELAYLFGKHVATIYRWFESVPGITLKKNSEFESRGKRRYRRLMIPKSVLIRFVTEHNIKIAGSSW
jgi:hypothetical protein